MTFYFDKLNLPLMDELTSNAGRIGHILRNYCQGYVNVNFPEILTLDNIAGQVEGQCRAIRGLLKNGGDLKPNILACARLSRFMKKIVAEDFFKHPSFESQKLDIIRGWVDNLQNIVKEIDNNVNNAILSVSQDIFGESSPRDEATRISERTDIPISDLKKEFNFDTFDEKCVEAEKTLEQFKNTLHQLGSFTSNLSHKMQDEVSDYINTPQLKDIANKIIGLAGDIENQGRAISAEASAPNPNVVNIGKYCDNTCNQIIAIKDFLKGKEFPKERVEEILIIAGIIQGRVIEDIRKVVAKGFKKI